MSRRAVERYGITGLAGVPPLWMQLADVEWPDAARRSLRYLTNTGGRMPAALTRRLRQLFPGARLFLMYGLTEAFRSTYLDPALVDAHPDLDRQGDPVRRSASSSRADGSEAAAGEPGELVHCGPLVAQGYWSDAGRTAARFRPAPARSSTAARRYGRATGACAMPTGLIYFVGRDDEMIKSAGNRVSPHEIEEATFGTGVAEAVARSASPTSGSARRSSPRVRRRPDELPRMPKRLPGASFCTNSGIYAAQDYPLARRLAAKPERQARPYAASRAVRDMSRGSRSIRCSARRAGYWRSPGVRLSAWVADAGDDAALRLFDRQ